MVKIEYGMSSDEGNKKVKKMVDTIKKNNKKIKLASLMNKIYKLTDNEKYHEEDVELIFNKVKKELNKNKLLEKETIKETEEKHKNKICKDKHKIINLLTGRCVFKR